MDISCFVSDCGRCSVWPCYIYILITRFFLQEDGRSTKQWVNLLLLRQAYLSIHFLHLSLPLLLAICFAFGNAKILAIFDWIQVIKYSIILIFSKNIKSTMLSIPKLMIMNGKMSMEMRENFLPKHLVSRIFHLIFQNDS